MVAGAGKGRQDAVTRYRVDAIHPRAAILSASPETGRMHQIRVHLASIGHPVIGDIEYGDPVINREFHEKFGLARQFLHAAEIIIPHPDGQRTLTLASPLAADLREVISRLENAR